MAALCETAGRLSLSSSIDAIPVVQNYLYLKTSVATQEQVHNLVLKCFQENDIVCDFKVVVIENREGLIGCTYVWVKDPKVFRMFTGENDDGSCQHRTVEDPEWQPPEISFEEAWAEKQAEIEDEEYDTQWEKTMAEEDARIALELLYKPATINVPVECKLKLPPFVLTPEQKKHLENVSKTGEEIPDEREIIVASAFYPPDRTDVNMDVLMARNVPQWITESDLKRMFTPFINDTTTKHSRVVSGRMVTDSYPFVTIISKTTGRGRVKRTMRNAYVYFEPGKGEGRMAKLVCHKMHLCAKRPDGSTSVNRLIFAHPIVRE
jgi:hypothetical protein